LPTWVASNFCNSAELAGLKAGGGAATAAEDTSNAANSVAPPNGDAKLPKRVMIEVLDRLLMCVLKGADPKSTEI
jgi:hypothetical protein